MVINYKVSPTFARFHACKTRYKFVMGPVGSGKSSGCMWDLFFNAAEQTPDENGVRHSRYAVIRATYPQLKSSTVKTFIEWFKDKITVTYGNPITARLNMDLDDGTRVNTEFMFVAVGDEVDAEKLRSWEFTGAWVNEAHEIPEYLLNTILPARTARYPALRSTSGPINPMIIVDYNAVPTDHWLYTWAEELKPENCSFFKQPPAVLRDAKGNYIINPEAENLENLISGYYENFVQISSKEAIQTDLMNLYGERKAGKAVYKDYNDDDHAAPLPISPPEGMHVIIGLDQGLCYTDRVSVLTNKGWKPFKDVDITKHKVLSRNPETGVAEWVTPLRKVEENHNGPMLRFKSQNAAFEVTPEHLIPYTTEYVTTPRFAPACVVRNKKAYVDLTSVYVGARPETLFGYPAKEYLKLLGWYLSEGSCEKETSRVVISNRNTENLAEIVRVCEALGLSPIRTKEYVRFSDAKMRKVLCNKQGLFYTKHIPAFVYKLCQDYILTFIDAFTRGDGYVRTRENGSSEHVCSTSSVYLRDGLQTLAQLVGWNSSWQAFEPRRSWYEKEQRWVQSSKTTYQVRFKKKAQKAHLLKEKWEEFHYEGKRYCLTVPWHTLYIRMDGIPSWNGNTPAAAFTFQDMDGKLVCFDEIVTEDCSLQEFAQERLWPLINTKYPWIKNNFSCVIDPAAQQRSMNDAKAGMEILKEAGLPIRLAKSNSPTDRREAVTYFLLRKDKFRLSPECKMLRRGFISEYKYEERRAISGAQFKEKPMKNIYSHVHDALQYAAMEYEGVKKRRAGFFSSNRLLNGSNQNTYIPASQVGGY